MTPNHEMPTIATVTVTSASPVAADAHNENTAAPVRRQQRKKTTFKVEKPSMQALLSPSIVRTRSFSDEDLAIHTPIPSVHVAKADSLEDVVNPPLTHKSSINSKRGSAIGQQEEKYERLNQVKRTLVSISANVCTYICGYVYIYICIFVLTYLSSAGVFTKRHCWKT